MTPVFIINFNRLTWPRAMLPHVVRLGGVPIILDQASTYPPLLAWYGEKPCEVVRMTSNVGPRGVWRLPVLRQCKSPFVVTDPDLDISAIPDDALAKMRSALGRHRSVSKIGLSLELEDLPPDAPLSRYARASETQYWRRVLPDGLFLADVDTTFALYRTYAPFAFSACRMPRPYTARHLPWYQNPKDLDPESLYYLRTANRTHSSIGPTVAKLERQSKGSQPPLTTLAQMTAVLATNVRFFEVAKPADGRMPLPLLTFLARHPFWKIEETLADRYVIGRLN